MHGLAALALAPRVLAPSSAAGGGAATAWCRPTASFFGVVPYETWGSLPVEQHGTWTELGCDDLLERPASATAGPTPQRHAYVSSMCGDATYLPAALVLGHSLRKTNTTKDMVLLVVGEIASDEATLGRLREVGWTIRQGGPTLHRPGAPSGGHEGARWRCFYSKLGAFNLTEYERVVLLDADTAVFRNVDELFDHPAPPNLVAAVPNDRYPGVEVNSGVLVLRPERRLADALARHVTSGAHIDWDGADQGLINQHFFGQVDYLPPFFNLMASASSDAYAVEWLLASHAGAIRIVHYVDNKPFWCGRETECTSTKKAHIVTLGRWWWRLFDELPWRPPGEDIYHRSWTAA